MYQVTVFALLAATFAVCAAATGSPVLAPRASSTVTPITTTGNGMCKDILIKFHRLQLPKAFFQGSDRFFIRGVAYAPGISIHKPEVDLF
jgi:hypothetical protein